MNMRRALHRARQGVALNLDEAKTLLSAHGDALDSLCEIAGSVRDQGLDAARRPGVITYSRKVFVPLTRLCRDRCHYCTFATVPHKLAAPFMEIDEAVGVARQGALLGC